MRRPAKRDQLDLFRKPDPDEGKRLRDEAKERMAESAPEWLERARATMVRIVEETGDCSSDDCWFFCPPPEDCHPSIMGCLFDDRRFVRTGDKLSERPSARARRIGVYQLKGKTNANR